ncbi:uncharacterized protein LOC130010914 [Patella vulgata]|uniref:uncharacterized protein LOC126816725 n=1 Tax=Patella vulgata TaxID=6465 RepID=UPI0021803282|nr:uncharacterized protein LOC126816725 [Patella vulgata]XP_050401963.1 uncharacterized protein LOC126818541 [Patella vulgata]XP_050404928.1 uncharacterized protein LOC126820837 [Patella vulgata]XP_055955102.1 uncharacterized protein LOC130010914 [Patella vulgata]
MCGKGLIIAIESTLTIAHQVLGNQKYLLCYKLSQDHLELFFNAIRRGGGWNNNPSAKVFESSFKRIITHCGALKVSKEGNCIAQDDTSLVQASTSTYLPPDAGKSENDDDGNGELDLYEVEARNLLDHSYSKNQLSLVTLNIIVYISGWIIRKLSTQLSCQICKDSLTGYPSDNCGVFHLLKNKQNGGLLTPSQSLVYVVMSAEKHLRRMTDVCRVNSSLNLLRLQTCVLTDCLAVDLFDSNHGYETHEGVENHNLSLIRSVVSVFFKLRQHHIVKLHNLHKQFDNCRHTLTKSILFKGQ